MTEGFKHQIKQWVTLDNELRLLNERVKELRQERQEILRPSQEGGDRESNCT